MRDGKSAGKIAQENHAALQDTDQQEILSGIVGRDLRAHFRAAPLDIFGRDENLRNIVFETMHSLVLSVFFQARQLCAILARRLPRGNSSIPRSRALLSALAISSTGARRRV